MVYYQQTRKELIQWQWNILSTMNVGTVFFYENLLKKRKLQSTKLTETRDTLQLHPTRQNDFHYFLPVRNEYLRNDMKKGPFRGVSRVQSRSHP